MKIKYNLRIYALLLSLLCLAQMVLPVSAVSRQQKVEGTYTSRVYYSTKPGSYVIGQFENGIELTVLAQSGDFYQVDCYDTVGYIPKTQVQTRDGKYYVNCEKESEHTLPLSYVKLEEALRLRSALLMTGKSKLGCPYVRACSGPNRFDCSGFTSYVYRENGYTISRASSIQPGEGLIISSEDLQVGDLMFYGGTNRGGYVTHVAMYAGDEMILHADSRGVVLTSIHDSYYAPRFLFARRVINVRATQIEQMTLPSAQNAKRLVALPRLR